MAVDPKAELRRLHRSGTGDLNTAIAFARAATGEDWDAMLALAHGLGEDDDLLGVIVWLALIAGGALVAYYPRGNRAAFLDLLAEAEREHSQ